MSQKPSLGRVVIVRLPDPIRGEDEVAAIVTQVWNEHLIEATLLPPRLEPIPLQASIYPHGHPYAGPYAWRWPDRGGPPERT